MKILIVGAGQNGGQAYNILKLNRSIEICAFVDDDAKKHGTSRYGLPVVGGVSRLREIAEEFRVGGAIAAVGRNAIRARIMERITAAGLQLVTAIHPHTFIEHTASIGDGSIVEMGVMIHPEARIGRGVFVGGSSVVAHDSAVGDYALIGGGVIFGGGVTVGAYSTLGVGTVLQPGVRIGRNVTTGIGSAVVKDVPDNAVAVGVPAKVIRYVEEEGIA